MTPLNAFFAFLISLAASTVGAICGIGGGVIIKPTLDLFSITGVSAASFLSCCTVLSMSMYSVLRSRGGGGGLDLKLSTPLGIGAAIGGVSGSLLFDLIKSMFDDPNAVGAPQAICLAVITAGTLVYTIFKSRIPSLKLRNPVVCVIIGLMLGLMSSFLGIGGGPINLVVLFFFFSMDTKTAATNSLYIILFSQAASFLTTIIRGKIPPLPWYAYVLMIAGGIAGGMIGRALNKRIESKTVDKLFMGLMCLIIIISIYNAVKYSIL